MAAVWKALLFFGVLHTGCLYAFAKVIKRTIVPHDAEPGHILLSLSNFGQEYTLDLNQVDEELSKFFTLTKIGDLITNQDISSLLDKSISLSINSANQDGIVKELVHIQVVKGGDMLVFQKPRYSGNVAENQPAGTIIQHLDITPRDTSRKDKIRYSLDSNTLLNVFALDVNNDIARIKTLVSLDREAVSHYEFKVLALNAVGEEATTTVSITVDDVNDNPPTLEQYEYSAEISHDIPIDTVITTIKATDPDENDAVTFALETPSSFFELNSATGDIVLKHRDGLSDKTYELVVYAKDSASHESNRATVTIELFGALKFKPLSRHRRATNPPIRHDVQETIQPGVFFRVTAQDVSNQNRFSMSDSELFSLDNQNGDLSLKVGKKLDYETAPALNGGGKGYTLNVEIKRDGTPDFLETVDVILSITDVNDEVPVFTNIPRRMLATMSANAPAGSNVYRLSASDPDAGSEVRFYKQSGDVDLFQVNEISGWITTKGANYIQNKEYKLTVYAQDLRGVGALPQTSTPSQVLIKVGERPPQFMFDPFRGDTPENVDVGTEVTQVSAFSFQSKQMRYSLVGDSNGRFSLEENGEILLLKTLDYETDPKTYTLLVTARESVTGLISTGTVSITLTDMNDNAPAFPLSTITTPPKSENTPVGTTIYTVEATDADSGVNSELTYKSLEPEIEVFTVGNKGNIVLVKKLDYESNAQHTYHFDIQVLDKGTPSKNGTVKMNVLVSNENDNAPYFSELLPKVDMSETAKSGDLITTLQAYDLDGDKVQFEVEQPNNTPFSVDADSGQITLTQALPPNPPASYTLKVLAKDDGSCCGTSVRNTNTTTVTIEVIDDVNSPPSFPQCDQYNPTVKEQQAFGTSVITVNAVDTDRGPNAKLVYSIIEDALGTKFTVNATSGEIKTAVTFDLEALPINNGRNSYPVTVRAKDSGVQPYEAICTFTVNIQDINDNAPKFDSSSYTRSIPRSADRDKQVFTLKATDKDLGVNSDITYSIDSQSVLHQFRVERVGTSASIILNKTLGLESRYDLVLRATDGGSDPRQLFTTVLVTINVNTGNKLPPLWEPPVEYVQQINENMGVNTAVYVIKAVSQNGGNVTSYAIINGGTPDTNSRRDFSRYANNKTHLVIRVNKPLDYEVVQSYTLRITAVEIIDGNKLYTEKVVNFAIIDKNDNKPNFIGVDAQDSYTFTVMENLNAGAEVISNIQAKDDDLTAPFNVVTYQVVDNSFFEMRNGKLFTKARFDREARKSYNFEVRATDGAVSDKPNNNGLPNSGTCLVIINIGDENDNKPEFTNSTYTATINENELTKSLIQVTATDLDEALLGDLTYSIIAGNIGSKFNVDPKSGEIAVIAGLDYEDIKQYTLTYRVSDKLNTATTTVIVNVKDVNDNAPVFSQSQYIVDSVTEEDTSISESNPLSLVTVSATDPDVDQNTQISFTLVLREGELPTFIINKATGEISLIRPLDRDTRAEYRVAIKATDAKIDGKDNDNPLSGHAELIVRPIDINDNAPTFSSSVLTGNVPENSVTGTTVMTIKADDADAGINAELVYTFGNSPYTSSFNIDPNTGVVTTAVNNLDREVTPRIEIPVIATDKGTPILSGSATATIMITDVNDVPPSFPQGVYKTDMPESLGKQASVYSVTCVDPDEGALTFSLIGTDDLKYFLIETNGKSGTLRLFKEIDYETGQKAFNLTVQVSDGISSATAYVEIQVLDSNDNVPEFETVQKQDEIPENQAVGSVVWTVTASDRDSTSPNNLFTFSIAKDSDPQGLFSVQRVSGAGSINVLAEVKIAKSLDRETVDTHTVKILAEDRGVLVQNTGTATLKIKVTDINDNCPIFKDNYQPQVMENKSPPRFVVNIEPVDADLPENNGPRFTCSLAPCNQQEPQCKFTGSSNTGGRGCIRIESKVTFDREAQKTYLVPIIMGDTGTPAMTCTNTLTVTIGDENDNPHGPGTKTVEVYNYKGQFQDVPLGTVYAPDKDDWDINEKTFTLVNTEKYFRMGSGDNHGNLMMLRGLPEGQHVVKVKVYDPKFPADVVSTMIVNCRMIGEEPVFSAGSFRAKGTAEDFIATPSGGKSKKTKFEELMAKALNTDVKNVDVFTVRNHDKDTFDVRFSAHGSPPYNESKLNMAIERNRQDFAGMGVDLLMVKVDECLKEDCEAGCTNTLVVTNDPLLVNSNSTSLVGVTSYITAECTCGARDFTKEEKCDPTSCYNGGTCIFVKNEDSSLNTYECQCLDGFMGPRCQETHHSFDGNSWAMYPTLAQCLDSKTSFEFITTSSSTNQLLMYNGPLNNPTNGVSDFIAVELVDGYPKVTVDHGTGATSVSITGKNSQNLQQLDKLNDGKWHKVDIIREGKKIRVVVDNCMSSTISSDGKTEDRSACEIEGVTPGENKFVNVNTPLQLGGRVSTVYPSGITAQGFDGCIKNFVHDSKLYDLHIGSTGEHSGSGSKDGCPREDLSCGVTVDQAFGLCGKHGTCIGTLDGTPHKCICDFGYMGSKCQHVTPPKDFLDKSYMKWSMLDTFFNGLSSRQNQIKLMVRTRDADGEGVLLSTLSKDSATNGRYALLVIKNGYPVFVYNLGSGEQELWLSKTVVVDGRWHNITLQRYGNDFILKMDRGDGRYYNETDGQANTNLLYSVDQNEIYGGGQDPDLQNSCMNDIRYDNAWFPMERQPQDDKYISTAAELVASEQIGPGCPSDACVGISCPGLQSCIDLWRKHECRCPGGYLMLPSDPWCADVNECLFTPSPCVHGTCINSPGTFSCECEDGYEGDLCDRKKEAVIVALGAGSIAAIVIAIIVLLILILALALWSRRRRSKPDYILEVEPDDDMRENIVHYDEDGAGEEDQDAYDISRLRKPVEPMMVEKPPVNARPLGSAAPDQPDVGNFIGDRLNDADDDPSAPPYDTLRLYDYEGDGSEAGSLSSLNSSSSDGSQNYDYLNDWGPRFQKLADMYGGGEED